MFSIVLTAKMCEMFSVKHKPGINLDTMFFVWQRANVMYVTGQRAMSLLLEKGRRGCWEKKAALIPRMPVLLWYHAQAVFVFRVWREGTSLCFCICVRVFMYSHVQWCFVVGVTHHIYWYTVGEVGGWSCITWHNRGGNAWNLCLPWNWSLSIPICLLFLSTNWISELI